MTDIERLLLVFLIMIALFFTAVVYLLGREDGESRWRLRCLAAEAQRDNLQARLDAREGGELEWDQ